MIYGNKININYLENSMEDKVFIKDDKEKFGDKHPHWMLVVYSLIYVGCVIISLFVIDKSIIPFLLVLSYF